MPPFSVSVTPPVATPVSLTEVKRQLQIVGNDDDELLLRLIYVAAETIRDNCKIAMITETRRLTLDRFPCEIRPDRAPLIAVTSITYSDTNETTQTLSSSLYTVDTQSRPGRIIPAYGESWPTTLYHENAVAVTYTAGYGSAPSSVPYALRHAVLLVVQRLFEGCENEKENCHAVESLTAPFALIGYA